MSTSRIDYCPLCCGDELDDGYCYGCGTDWTDPEDALRAADSLRQTINSYTSAIPIAAGVTMRTKHE